MATATELYRLTKLNDTHAVSVLLAEEGNSTKLLGLLYRHIPMVLQRYVVADALIYDTFNLAQLLSRDLLEVAEVKTKTFWCNE